MFLGRHFYRKKAAKQLVIDRVCTVGLRRPNWTLYEFVRTGVSKYWPRTKSCEKLFTHETLNCHTCAQAHANIHVAPQTRSTTVETGYIEYWPGRLWTRIIWYAPTPTWPKLQRKLSLTVSDAGWAQIYGAASDIVLTSTWTPLFALSSISHLVADLRTHRQWGCWCRFKLESHKTSGDSTFRSGWENVVSMSPPSPHQYVLWC